MVGYFVEENMFSSDSLTKMWRRNCDKNSQDQKYDSNKNQSKIQKRREKKKYSQFNLNLVATRKIREFCCLLEFSLMIFQEYQVYGVYFVEIQ